MSWSYEYDRRRGYTVLALFRNNEARGSVILNSKDEEEAWDKAIKTLILNQKDNVEKD